MALPPEQRRRLPLPTQRKPRPLGPVAHVGPPQLPGKGLPKGKPGMNKADKLSKPGKGMKAPGVGKGKKGGGKGMGRMRRGRPLPFNKRLVAPPWGTLTYGQLGKETRAAREYEFAPERQELADQATQSQVRQQAAGNWFDQYKRDIAASGQAQQQQIAQAQGEAASYGAQSQAQDTARRQQLENQNRSDAASRGAIYTPDNSEVNAQNSRQMLTDAYRSMLSAQGAARGAYSLDRGNAASGAQLSARLQEGRVGQQIANKRLGLRQKAGQFATKYRGERIGKEHEYSVTRGTLLGNLAKNKAQIKGQALDRRQKSKESKQKLKLEREALDLKRTEGERSQAYRDAKLALDRYKATHAKPGSGGSGLTPTAVRGNSNDWNAGLSYIRSVGPAYKGKPPEQIKTELMNTRNVPDDIATALVDWTRGRGTLSPQNYRAMTKLGIKIDKRAIRKR